MKIRKGDKVKVLSGKDRDKEGKVSKVFPSVGKVLVEGVNMVKKNIKGKGKQKGERISVNAPVAVSNVQLICPKCKKSSRVGWKEEADSKVRFCKKCKEAIE